MKILLVGHKGYVGSGLAAALKTHHEVIGWGHEEDLFKLSIKELIRLNIDILINCAVVMDRNPGPYQLETPTDTVNVQGARHLAQTLKGSMIPWFQISTKDVFGNVFKALDVDESPTGYRPKRLIGDDEPFNPKTPYAKSKLMAETICEDHPYSNVIRLSTCYSDLVHPKGNWMTHFIQEALKKEPIRVTHNGKQFRDPLHTDDLAALIVHMTTQGLTGHKLNAGGGAQNIISLLEFIREIDPELVVRTTPGDDYGFAFSNERAKAIVGWSPKILVREKIPNLKKTLSRDQELRHA